MVKNEKLRWGILGTGRINRVVIPAIRASKYSQLISIASRSREKVEMYAKEWNIPQFYSSYDTLLEDPNIDVIYNSLPNELHAIWSIKAMQMGKHVLCEKPLTTHDKDAEAIIEVSRKTGKIISEAFMYRHHPQTIFVKEIVNGGEIGKILLIQGSFCFTNARTNDPRFDPTLGGGSLWDVGCYPINYACFLIGKKPKEVYGHQIIGPTGIDLLYAGQIIFQEGEIFQFDCSFISPGKSKMEITGDKGRLTIPYPYKPGLSTKIVLELNGKPKTIKIKGAELYQGEIEDLENAILFGKPSRISLEESKLTVNTIEALYQSARLSQPITVNIQN